MYDRFMDPAVPRPKVATPGPAAYLWAPVTAAFALCVRLTMHPLLQEQIPYETFYIAVLISSRYGGIGPGLLAMVLGGLAAIYFFIPPRGFVLHGADNQVAFGMYILVSVIIVRLHEAQRRARLRAEAGQRTLDAILEHIPEGIAIADAPDARVRMVSRWGAEVAGRKPEELVDLPSADRAAAWGICRADGKIPAWEELPMTRAVLHGESVEDEEWILRRPGGEAVPILCSAAPIRDEAGRITGGLTAWRDISQRKEMEEKLREAAKLESLGALAGGIAHDFNNLLTGIVGNASLLGEEIPEGTSLAFRVQNILKAAEAASKLT